MSSDGPTAVTVEHATSRDVEDVDAVLERTGASRVLGLSSGAVFTLEAARTLPRVTAAAVYEPLPCPALIRALPTALVRRLAVDTRRPGAHARLRDLLPGIRYDFNAVAGMDGNMGTFAFLDEPVLLVGGSESPAFLRRSVRDLERVLPRGQRVELEGLAHSGPWNASRGGRPALVAAVLQQFFA